MDADQNEGYIASVGRKLQTPFSTSMTWTQLAAVVVFIGVVALAWRQVVLMIEAEI